MTVAAQIMQALANAKSVQAEFESYALQTQDEAAKQTYANAAAEMQMVIEGLEARMKQIEQEEPEFRND